MEVALKSDRSWDSGAETVGRHSGVAKAAVRWSKSARRRQTSAYKAMTKASRSKGSPPLGQFHHCRRTFALLVVDAGTWKQVAGVGEVDSALNLVEEVPAAWPMSQSWQARTTTLRSACGHLPCHHSSVQLIGLLPVLLPQESSRCGRCSLCLHRRLLHSRRRSLALAKCATTIIIIALLARLM